MATHTITPTPRVLILKHSIFYSTPAEVHWTLYRLPWFIPTNYGSRRYNLAWHWWAYSSKNDQIWWSTRPDIVIVQLGTNNLTFQSPLQVGSELEDFVRLLHDSYGVKFVSVCQTIHRCSVTAFNKNVDLLTRTLRVVLEPIPYAICWGHRCFWKARHNFYADNGVHLNSKGRYKLYRSYSEAVLKSMRLLSSVDFQ